MLDMKPESPLTMEEILLLWGYIIHFKDEDVCTLENPKDRKSRPICIPQKVGPDGVSVEIMQHILFDARIDSFQYQALLAKVQAQQQLRQSLQTKSL